MRIAVKSLLIRQGSSLVSHSCVPPGTITWLQLNTAEGMAPTYYLREHLEGKVFRLIFCGNVNLDDLPLETLLKVTYNKIVGGVIFSCSRPGVSADSSRLFRLRRKLLSVSPITPTAPRVLLFITTFCGIDLPAAVTLEVIERAGDARIFRNTVSSGVHAWYTMGIQRVYSLYKSFPEYSGTYLWLRGSSPHLALITFAI